MNTLIDTDEGRARPSVWPVYVVAAVIGVASLVIALPNFSSLLGPRGFLVFFGLLTAYGLFRLRTWAWWCALLWTVVVAVTVTLVMLLVALCSGMAAAESGHSTSGWWAIAMVPGFALVVLLVWPLVARRQLFF